MTNPTQWISAALKILSIWLLVGATTSLPMFAGYVAMELYSSSDDPIARAGRWGGIGSLIGQLTTIAIAIVMWRRSGALARQIWADAETSMATEGTLTADRVQLIAFSLFGLGLLIGAVPDLLREVLVYRTYPDLPEGFTAADPAESTRRLGELLLPAVQIVLGLWLLLYPDGLAALLRRLRDAITFADTERR